MKHSVSIIVSVLFFLGYCSFAFAVDLTNNIDAAISLGKAESKNILVIFSIDQCIYCKKLKEDMSYITNLDSFIVCNIDGEYSKRINRIYSIRNYPSSIILSYQNNHKLLSKKIGYKNYTDYDAWLNQYIE